MATYGYMRISTTKKEQKFDRQEQQLIDKVDKMYMDRLSGKSLNRPQLREMIDGLMEGDIVLILAIDRISRSTKDLLEIVSEIQEKGASLKSLTETWLDTTGDNPMSEFLMVVMGALGEWERKNTVKRVNEGLAVAKAKGKQLGRPPVNKNKVQYALELYDKGEHTGKEISDICGISRKTLYNHVNKRENGKVGELSHG